MATHRFADPALSPSRQVPASTGDPVLDIFSNTPAETRQEGDHTVEIHRDPATHIAVTESWRDKDGNYDRADGPSLIIRDPKTGFVCTEEWFSEGKHHRAGGPAVIDHDPKTGVVSYEAWYQHGKSHRLDGPALTVRDPTSNAITVQKWFRDGILSSPFDLASPSTRRRPEDEDAPAP